MVNSLAGVVGLGVFTQGIKVHTLQSTKLWQPGQLFYLVLQPLH